MPTRPIYPGDTAVELTGDMWVPAVDPTRTPASDQNVRVAGSAFMLPDQTTHSGEYLTTNGTTASWSTVSGSTNLSINAQTGTTYTVVDGDLGKLVTLSNASTVSVTLPQAGSGGNFASGWYAYFRNLGAGEVNITPTTSTISSASVMRLPKNASVLIISNGTNYYSSVYAEAGTGADSASIASRGNITISADNAAALASGNTASSLISGVGSAIIATSGNNGTSISGAASAVIASTGGDFISGEGSAAIGGGNNTISAAAAVTLGGGGMTSSGRYSVSMGLSGGAINAGSWVINGGNYSSGSRSPQSHTQVQGMGDLQSATTVEFYFDAGTTQGRFYLPDNCGAIVQASAVVQDNVTMSKINAFVLMTGSNPGAVFYRGSGAGTITMLGAPTMNSVASNGNGTHLTMTVGVDTGQGNVKFTVTDSTGGDQFYGALTIQATIQRH
jgi:hypothetical protein